MGKRKQQKCRICKKRPPWRYKNCPPGVCKRCYHKHVWADRPAASKARGASTAQQTSDALGSDDEMWMLHELAGEDG